jgi:DNA-binding NarL/FixJ family response regulator
MANSTDQYTAGHVGGLAAIHHTHHAGISAEALLREPGEVDTRAVSTNVGASGQSTAQSSDATAGGQRVAFIEHRSLIRESLIRSLASATGWTVLPYDDAAAWLDHADAEPVSLVVLCVGNAGATINENPELARLSEIATRAPVALMADSEDPSHIVGALERHVRGYIPTSLPMHVAVEALRLVRAGGVYVPASSLIASQKSHAELTDEQPKTSSLFTTRQLAVIAALRKGKANKIIAYELNMRESTVKVHVRNIMKKLKARNRTEVAYLANSMLSADKR